MTIMAEPIPVSSGEHLAYIDLLRGFAIFGVLAAHGGLGLAPAGLSGLPLNIDWLLGAGKHGVSLFFVVSAYTLMRSMSSRHHDEPLPLPYMVRRFFRIAPVYYLVITLVFFFHGEGFDGYSSPEDNRLTWGSFGAHLLFVNGLFPYHINNFLGVEWSIAAEVMFYALLPVIFIWLRRSGNNATLAAKACALYLAGLALFWVMYFKSGYVQSITGLYPGAIFGAWTYFFVFTHLHEFAIGIAVWVLLRIAGNRAVDRFAFGGARLWLAILISCGAVLACWEVLQSDNFYMVVGGQVLWGLLGAGLLIALESLRPPPILGLTFLGKISFSLYLVHMPVFYGLSRSAGTWRLTDMPLLNHGIYLTIAWCLSLGAAIVLFYLIEKPGMRLGQMLLTRSPKSILAT